MVSRDNPVFTESGFATSGLHLPTSESEIGPTTSEPEVGESVATAAEMCVFAPSSASVAGASVPVSASEHHSLYADAPCPSSAEASAYPGATSRDTARTPAAIR